MSLNQIDISTPITLVGIIPVALYFIKSAIDSFDMTTVEKIFLTPFQRFSYFMSKSIILGFIIGTIYGLPLLWTTENNTFELTDFVIFLILAIMISVIFSTILFSWVSLFTVKTRFYVKYKDSNWRIIKRVNSKQLLVSKGKKEFEFVDAEIIQSETILEVLEKERKLWFHDIITKNIYRISIISTLVLIGLFVLNFFVFNNNEWILLCLFILGYICLIHIIVVYSNNKVLKEFGSSIKH